MKNVFSFSVRLPHSNIQSRAWLDTGWYTVQSLYDAAQPLSLDVDGDEWSRIVNVAWVY